MIPTPAMFSTRVRIPVMRYPTRLMLGRVRYITPMPSGGDWRCLGFNLRTYHCSHGILTFEVVPVISGTPATRYQVVPSSI